MFSDLGNDKAAAKKLAQNFIEVCKAIGRDEEIKEIQRAVASLDQDKYTIAVVGQMKRGKSTFINTLLNQSDDHLSPIDELVCTGAIVHYLPNDELSENVNQSTVYFQNGTSQNIANLQLKSYISEKLNPKNTKRVSHISTYGDFPVLNGVASLVDTPGFGAIHEHHEQLLRDHVMTFDAILFLISADLPLEAAEKEFLKFLYTHHKEKVFFVMSKVDSIDPQDLDEVRGFVQSNLSEIGYGAKCVHEVSAREVYHALRDGASEEVLEEKLQSSGMQDFKLTLESFIIQNSFKTTPLRHKIESLEKLILEKNKYLSNGIKSQMALYHESASTIQSDLQALTQANDELLKSFERSWAKFEIDWSCCLQRFQRKLNAQESRVESSVAKLIDEAGIFSGMTLPEKVRKKLQGEVQMILEKEVLDLEESIEKPLRRLHEDLSEAVELYANAKIPKAFSDLVLGTASVGVNVLGGILVVGQAGGLFASMAQVLTTSTAIQGSPGLFVWAQGLLFGSSATALGSAQVAALGGLLSTAAIMLPVGVATLGGMWISSLIVKNTLEKGLAEKIQFAMDEAYKEVVIQLDQVKTSLKERIQEELETKIQHNQMRAEELHQAKQKLDPEYLPKLEGMCAMLEQFSKTGQFTALTA